MMSVSQAAERFRMEPYEFAAWADLGHDWDDDTEVDPDVIEELKELPYDIAGTTFRI